MYSGACAGDAAVLGTAALVAFRWNTLDGRRQRERWRLAASLAATRAAKAKQNESVLPSVFAPLAWPSLDPVGCVCSCAQERVHFVAGRRAEAGGAEDCAGLQWPLFLSCFLYGLPLHVAASAEQSALRCEAFFSPAGLHRPQSSRDVGERDSGMRGFLSSRTLSFLARAYGPLVCWMARDYPRTNLGGNRQPQGKPPIQFDRDDSPGRKGRMRGDPAASFRTSGR